MDIFISHASEDKDDIVRSLADALIAYGYDVWYDEYSLNIGDSLREEINKGLSECNWGIVVLSQNFFRKRWTNQELNGLFSREYGENRNLLLPIWHGVNRVEVASYSPIIADRIAIPSDKGIKFIVSKIAGSIPVKDNKKTKKISDELLNEETNDRNENKEAKLAIQEAFEYLNSKSFNSPREQVIEDLMEYKIFPAKYQYLTDDSYKLQLKENSNPNNKYNQHSLNLINRSISYIIDSIGNNSSNSSVDYIACGVGSGVKDAHILQEIHKSNVLENDTYYYPMDVNDKWLLEAIKALSKDKDLIRTVKTKAILGDITSINTFIPIFEYRPCQKLYTMVGNIIGSGDEKRIIDALNNTIYPGDMLLFDFPTTDCSYTSDYGVKC